MLRILLVLVFIHMTPNNNNLKTILRRVELRKQEYLADVKDDEEGDHEIVVESFKLVRNERGQGDFVANKVLRNGDVGGSHEAAEIRFEIDIQYLSLS